MMSVDIVGVYGKEVGVRIVGIMIGKSVVIIVMMIMIDCWRVEERRGVGESWSERSLWVGREKDAH